WDELYDTPGFAILAGNFPEIFLDEAANREISDYIAERIRQRVSDPKIADKLIPKDHGFALQRLPLETRYFEAYNRDNVKLVDLSESPIERITAKGIQTSAAHYDLDLIVYATGFDAITGGFDRMQIRGVGGKTLGDKWREGPSTYLGLLTHGFPNLIMVAGPQSVSGSTNFPRAIENAVDWTTELLIHAIRNGHSRFDAQAEAEQEWGEEVVRAHEKSLARRSQGWFTGYNSNVIGHEAGTVRYQAYFGGGPKYVSIIKQAAADGYPRINMS
ncbi:MAG: cyclohexanone monooxygenase, partial [Pseudomonadales bacterium]